MTAYLIAMLVVFVANAVPAFAPPTWTLLVFLEFNYELQPAALVLIGVVAATAGRALMATYMRRSTRWMPRTYVTNMQSAAQYLTKTRGRVFATFVLFFISPLSSAQLFAAAGIMKSVRLQPLLLAFAAGRTLSYSSYVTGAHLVKQSSVGDVVLETLKSPWALAVQLLMVAGVIALGMHDWTSDDSGESAVE
jgi:hypothetical protein